MDAAINSIMETLVDEEYKHFHDTSEHGLVWVLLSQMLHLIVLAYSLFGMIRFKLKFINMVRLVKWISYCMIAHSWYITIKFALIATLMYSFNFQLNALGLSMSQFNCSLANEQPIYQALHRLASDSNTLSSLSKHPHQQSTSNHPTSNLSAFDERYPILLARILSVLGGPYKLLGNRATLMYGFYAIAVYILLAIFPLELIYLDIAFNYIRFVLNDNSCLQDLYDKKQKHLDRLNNWSRNKNTSMLTLSMKRTINQRALRCLNVYDSYQWSGLHEVSDTDCSNRLLEASYQHSEWQQNKRKQHQQQVAAEEDVVGAPDVNSSSSPASPRALRPTKRGDSSSEPLSVAPLKSLRHSLSLNHMDKPSYSVQVANENLKKFKPHVRSENWFKLSMVVYPIFVFFYFSKLSLIIAGITAFFNYSLEEMNNMCVHELNNSTTSSDLFSGWSLLDGLTFYETQYMVFVLSYSSSFYCSYYFGTIMELTVWMAELSQQLNLCKLVLEYSHSLQSAHMIRELVLPEDSYVNMTFRKGEWSPIQHLALAARVQRKSWCSSNLSELKLRSLGLNQFGGLDNIWSYIRFSFQSQSARKEHRQIMALCLLTKRQTLLRATYLNMNLFFDELNATKFLTKTILGRTTQLAFGFALMVSITRSQFKSNYIYLTYLLAAALLILNLYLICAALVNSGVSMQHHGRADLIRIQPAADTLTQPKLTLTLSLFALAPLQSTKPPTRNATPSLMQVNKMLPQIHQLISASIKVCADHDLLEFWLRHIQAYGVDKDAMSYKIYGFKITWGSILNVGSH